MIAADPAVLREATVDPPVLREAAVADASGIARCHVLGWQAGCAGLLPADHLSGLTIAASQRRWESGLARPGHGVTVALSGDVVVGFTRTGPTPDPRPTDDPTPGELRELYVDPPWWGSGVADALHRLAIDDLVAAGFGAAVLWVVEGNERALRFYRRRGWRRDGWRRSEQSGEVSWQEIRLTGQLLTGQLPTGPTLP